MKKLVLAVLVVMLAVSFAFAAPKTYQWTGEVTEVKDDMVSVKKGKEIWQIGRDKDTKITGDLKVGSKVTVEYTMKAVKIEGKADKKADKKDDKKTEPKKEEKKK